MNQGMINKLISVLETTLSKLSRYDEGSFIGSILSLTVRRFVASRVSFFFLLIQSECERFLAESFRQWKRNGTSVCKFHQELYGSNS